MTNNKEKKPAPSANDASPKQNLSKKNDSTEKAKCQEHITVPEELSEDLFKLMIKLVQDMITSCVRHGIRDTRLVSRAVYAAIMTSLEIFFEHEEGSDEGLQRI